MKPTLRSTTSKLALQEPNYGFRLLPHVLDDLAASDPHRIHSIYPRTSSLTQGYRHVTMRELANAVNGFAHWLESAIGKSEDFATVAYFGLSDIRYTIILLAAVKCGYKVSEQAWGLSRGQGKEGLIRRFSC